MPIYNITYHTINQYTSKVAEAVLDFLVLPATINGQDMLNIEILAKPVCKHYLCKNTFGFEVMRFRLKNINDCFDLAINMTVKKEHVNPFGFISLPINEEKSILNSDIFSIDNYIYTNPSPLTTWPTSYPLLQCAKHESTFEFALRVSQYIYDNTTYDTDIKNPLRPLIQTLNEKRGVCQDYSHMMLAILKSNNIPARYVSGYLNQGNGSLGAAAVHAWVQVLVPGIGWVGIDPTNNLLEDHNYIKISHGVDINDCTTLKGVVKSPGQNQTNYHVLVKEQNKEINQ